VVLSPGKTFQTAARRFSPPGDISPVVEGEIGGPKIFP